MGAKPERTAEEATELEPTAGTIKGGGGWKGMKCEDAGAGKVEVEEDATGGMN
jgi:hypothetical protein